MNIFFYRYGSICEPDIMESFRNIGFDIIEESTEIYNKRITPEECIRIVSPILTGQNFQFAFTINFFPWLSELCNIIHLPYLSLIVDSPVLELYSNTIRNSCNRIFLFDKVMYQEFSKENPEHIFHIPLASNVNRYSEIIEKAPAQKLAGFTSDISFVGSLYSEKCPYNHVHLPDFEKGYADGLIEAQLKIYGYNFLVETITDDFVNTFMKYAPDFYQFPENSRINNKAVTAQQYLSIKVSEQERTRALYMLSEHFQVDIYTGSDTSMMPHIHNRGFAKTHDEMPLIFNRSKINLNFTSKAIRSGLPLRIFDVLACKGFLITNYQAELSDIFTIGGDLETYGSMEELYDKVQYYLTHNDEREKIAQKGYETIKNQHSYDTRVLQILNTAFNIK